MDPRACFRYLILLLADIFPDMLAKVFKLNKSDCVIQAYSSVLCALHLLHNLLFQSCVTNHSKKV